MKGIDTVSAFLPQYEYIPKSAVKKYHKEKHDFL